MTSLLKGQLSLNQHPLPPVYRVLWSSSEQLHCDVNWPSVRFTCGPPPFAPPHYHINSVYKARARDRQVLRVSIVGAWGWGGGGGVLVRILYVFYWPVKKLTRI